MLNQWLNYLTDRLRPLEKRWRYHSVKLIVKYQGRFISNSDADHIWRRKYKESHRRPLSLPSDRFWYYQEMKINKNGVRDWRGWPDLTVAQGDVHVEKSDVLKDNQLLLLTDGDEYVVLGGNHCLSAWCLNHDISIKRKVLLCRVLAIPEDYQSLKRFNVLSQ